MKEQYGRLIMVTDTIPTLRTLSRLHRLEFTLELKRSMPAPKFVVCSSKKEIRSGAIQDKKCGTDSRNMSLSRTHSAPFFFFFFYFILSLLQYLHCQSCLCLITLFIPLCMYERCTSLWRLSFGFLQVFGSFPDICFHGLSKRGSFLKPCASSA